MDVAGVSAEGVMETGADITMIGPEFLHCHASLSSEYPNSYKALRQRRKNCLHEVCILNR